MKTLKICVLIMLLAGTSCRSIKESSQSRYGNSLSDERITSLLYSNYDSLDRFWLYETDSIFYYRPGEGLYGHNGKLWIHEKEIRESEKAEIHFEEYREEEKLLEKEKKVVYDQKPFWVAGAVLLIGAVMLLQLFWKW